MIVKNQASVQVNGRLVSLVVSIKEKLYDNSS